MSYLLTRIVRAAQALGCAALKTFAILAFRAFRLHRPHSRKLEPVQSQRVRIRPDTKEIYKKELQRGMDLDDSDVRSRVEGLLTALGGLKVAILGCARLSGAVNENWHLRLRNLEGPDRAEQHWVLRTGATSALGVSLGRMQEFTLQRLAWQSGIRVAEPLFFSPATDVLPAFFVMRFVPGSAHGPRLVKDDALVHDRALLVADLGRMLARIHALPTERVATVMGSPKDSGLAAFLNGCRDYLSTHAAAHPVLEWGILWLTRFMPRDVRGDVPLHRDFRTGNFLVEDGTLSAILDWEFAGFGDPREDLGCFFARCFRFGRDDRKAGGLGMARDFLEGYAEISPRRFTYEDTLYFQVLAHLRFAIICLQQAERNLHGEANLERGHAARTLPELEWEILNLTAPYA
jgi:aminoglycoside phosphotransferase (APT) family kinase protein